MARAEAQKPMRWGIRLASREFGTTPDTLRRRLIAANISAAEDETYSTAQIIAAVFGDMAGERLGKVRAEREAVELKNARIKKDHLPASEIERAISKCFQFIRAEILGNSTLGFDEKRSLLSHLADYRPPT